MKNYKSKIIILILLSIIFILINMLQIKENHINKDINKEKDILKEEISKELENEKQKITMEIVLEALSIGRKNSKKEAFINYKFHTRLQKKALNSLKFNSKFFNIEEIKSEIDYNNNGIDDYTDILEGSRIFTDKKPLYLSAYYEGGYPPEGEGVCTDVVWSALKKAGYNLKDLIDADIKKNTKLYPATEGKPDPNIDFRRVRNLDVFFPRNVEFLTLDVKNIKEWQPGDIVTFGHSHIGIISNIRNYKGMPYVIHHGGRTPAGEYNILSEKANISGHYRFKLK